MLTLFRIGFILLLVGAMGWPARGWSQGIPAPLAEQIRALQAEKAARSPAELKISSQLLYAERIRRGVPAARGIATLRTDVQIAADGTTPVDLRADVTRALLERIRALGGSVIHAAPRHRAVRARVPIERLSSLAELAAVQSIRPADRAVTRKLNTSAGDAAHRADQLRTSFGVDGTGISVGVLSDGVDSLASLQSSGDLPPTVTVLPGQAGAGSEGTAMLEIVHDLAPGADLLFATAFTSQASFASNILALHAAGADVIVDDVGYFAEAVFQDDDVAAAVNSVTAAGALYFSSAGNSGNLDDGTSGVWEGDFSASGSSVNGSEAHDFGGGETRNEITKASSSVYTLHWSDPKGASANDYDLLLVNKQGTVIFAASTDVQNGNDDPFEIIAASGNDRRRKLMIVRKSGSDRHLHLNANRGELAIATAGQTSGHSAARNAFSVAAVDVRSASGPFDGSESVQTYSSDGPRRIFYEADGTPITPGNFLSTGGELRDKPDLTAADCVSTATPGFSTFCGTSAAAPHAAAIAALLQELQGSASPQQIRDALAGTALDIEAVGLDRDSGAGIIEALAAGGELVECQVDADCDDTSFCNGVETCSAGACLAGPGDPCSAGPLPFCDETGDLCAECLGAADCDDSSFCNGVETCGAGACLAGPGDPCSAGPLPFCDETGDLCAECLGDGDCDDSSFCNGVETCNAGACLAGAGDPCSAGPLPFCDETGDLCAECLGDGDCTGGSSCGEGVCLMPVPALQSWTRIVLGASLMALAVAMLGGLVHRPGRPRA